jgi:hypothetical protein
MITCVSASPRIASKEGKHVGRNRTEVQDFANLMLIRIDRG